jgi:hypothetical protein
MAMSPSPKPSRSDPRASPSPSGQRTLTPQRKHRKMLKDGTSEVWPESVEKIFVNGETIPFIIACPSYLYVCVTSGLRQYWESPWATYSRGRSRWRNQFLVDYLKDQGIERSKKQVASHIQVLRNMWKGEKGLYRHTDSPMTRLNLFLFFACDQSTNWSPEAKSFSRRTVYLLTRPVLAT